MTSTLALAVRSEWVKLRALRSSAGAALAIVALTVGIGAFSCAVGSTDATRAGQGDDDVVFNSLRGVLIGQLAVLAFGVSNVCAEYASGLIRVTLLAVPRRWDALAAKAVVLFSVVLVAGVAASLASFLIGQPLLHEGGFVPPAYPEVTLADASVLRAVSGAALYFAAMALLGLGIGAIVRQAAPAISIAFGLVVVPFVASALLSGAAGDLVLQALPVAGMAVLSASGDGGVAPISPWAGLGVTAAWAAGSLLVAGWVVRRRDA
jgi:ABC-2 type transport system permease protein